MIPGRKISAFLGVLVFLCFTAPQAAAALDGPGRIPPPGERTASIARLIAPTKALTTPGGRKVVSRIGARAEWNGGPAAFLILRSRTTPDGRLWLKVRLPDRPNGSSGWINADRARVSRTPWRIRVDLGDRTVTLLKGGRPVLKRRAVIGSKPTPTPRGLFAISERVRQPDPSGFLGNWALLLTAHSNTLRRYDGGPGQIAIHGRAGASLLAPLGSAASHGCVRIDNRPVARIAAVAREGTPVRIRR